MVAVAAVDRWVLAHIPSARKYLGLNGADESAMHGVGSPKTWLPNQLLSLRGTLLHHNYSERGFPLTVGICASIGRDGTSN